MVTTDDKEVADVIWVYDMMAELDISQHNMCSCSVTTYGDLLFVNTSNGVDESHIKLPSPEAPSFICMDKNTAEVYWTNKSPGTNILHGQWSSPAIGVLGGVPQVVFGGGDGWVYSFKADKGSEGKPELLWKFDANPKTSKWILGGAGTRNSIIATLGWIDAPQVSFTLAMLGVLTNRHIDQPASNRRRHHEIVAFATTSEKPLGMLGVAIEFPQQLALTITSTARIETVQPTVAAWKQYLS